MRVVLVDSQDCFPITSIHFSQIACKVQLNEDLQEEISHHYTYTMSALYVPTDFMWAAGIYFRNQSDFPVPVIKRNCLDSTSSYICHYDCVQFPFLILRVFLSIQTFLAEDHWKED